MQEEQVLEIIWNFHLNPIKKKFSWNVSGKFYIENHQYIHKCFKFPFSYLVIINFSLKFKGKWEFLLALQKAGKMIMNFAIYKIQCFNLIKSKLNCFSKLAATSCQQTKDIDIEYQLIIKQGEWILLMVWKVNQIRIWTFYNATKFMNLGFNSEFNPWS